MSTPFSVKVQVVLRSIVTYATLASAGLGVLVSELRTTDVLPSNWVAPILAFAAAAIAVLGIAVKVLKRVMPVPEEGVAVTSITTPNTSLVRRGWE